MLYHIGLVSRVFTNGLGDQGSITGQVLPKAKKWYLMPPCLTLSIIRYGSRVKWSNPGKDVVPSPTPWCNCWWKGSLWVALDYVCQLYFYITYHFQMLILFTQPLHSGRIWHKVWGARGVMVIVAGCGHLDTSSNLGRAWLHFT